MDPVKDMLTYGLNANLNDGYIDLIHQWYWVVQLTNGIHVYQDDGRPDCMTYSTWVRLGRYLKEHQTDAYEKIHGTKIGIQRFGVYFRGNHMFMKDCAGGYYFANGVLKGVGVNEELHYYVMGFINDDKTVSLAWIKVPEIVPINIYEKRISDCEAPMLILNPPGLTWHVPVL